MSEHVLVEIQDGVATLTLNRAQAFNAISLELAKALNDAVEQVAADSAVRVVVLTGAGDKAFCAGGDVASFAVSEQADKDLAEITLYLHTAISRLAHMAKPWIAKVNGVAAGAGLSLVAAADLAIAKESCKFTSAYTGIGLSPDGSSSWFLPRVVGVRRATELYLTNRTLNAAEALDWGLLTRVVNGDNLDAEVEKLAAQLASGPTLAYGKVKKLMLYTQTDSLESQMQRETRYIAECAMTDDAQAGFQAFVNKQKPEFHGR
jgi:2-(1,2-epoxy-1,2-dihydrophenyl)acetyl-CoA isomerase